MAAALESIIATRKFARVPGDETDPTELSLEDRSMQVGTRDADLVQGVRGEGVGPERLRTVDAGGAGDSEGDSVGRL